MGIAVKRKHCKDFGVWVYPYGLILPYCVFSLSFSSVEAYEEMAEKMRAHIRQDARCLHSILPVGESLLASMIEWSAASYSRLVAVILGSFMLFLIYHDFGTSYHEGSRKAQTAQDASRGGGHRGARGPWTKPLADAFTTSQPEISREVHRT